MKPLTTIALLAMLASPALAADVGISVTVSEPGLYGRIDIGNLPAPRVVYPKPVVVETVPVKTEQPPIYLHVPPGHAKHWKKHCHEYGACGQRVYFVRDDWYDSVYVPSQKKGHKERGEKHHGHRD